MPTNVALTEQQKRLEEELSFRIAGTGVIGLVNSRSYLQRTKWNVDAAFILYTNEKLPTHEVNTAVAGDSDSPTSDDKDGDAVDQGNSAEVLDKQAEIKAAKGNASRLVTVELTRDKTLEFPVCKPDAIPTGLCSQDRIRYANASIAQKTSCICTAIVLNDGTLEDESEDGNQDLQKIAEAMSAVTPLLDSGIQKGKKKATNADEDSDDQSAPGKFRGRKMKNYYSFRDLASNMKITMGEIVTNNHNIPSKARDQMLLAIKFKNGHASLKGLTAEHPQNPDTLESEEPQRKLRQPAAIKTLPATKAVSKNAKKVVDDSNDPVGGGDAAAVVSEPSSTGSNLGIQQASGLPTTTPLPQTTVPLATVQLPPQFSVANYSLMS